MNYAQAHNFMMESNRIEGIHRAPTEAEIGATLDFVSLPKLTVQDVVALVKVYQPNAVLRDSPELNVRVGQHIAPRGGSGIVRELESLLAHVSAREGGDAVYRRHCEYETLHPFTDGNGRSGRAIWLWGMRDYPVIGFLHMWYYQSLQALRS